MMKEMVYTTEDVRNAGSEFKVGQFVKYVDNFDVKRAQNRKMKAQVVGVFPYHILLEVFGKLGNFLISCNRIDILTKDVTIKPMKPRKKLTYYNSRNC